MVKPRKRRFIFIESDSDKTEQFLQFKDVKISLHIIVLIVRGCFDRTHGLNKFMIFALDARVLLLHNCDKLSCIFFMCIINT